MEFNKVFCPLHWKLHPPQQMPAEILDEALWYDIKKSYKGVSNDLVRYIGMQDRPPTLPQRMGHIGTLNMSVNKSQPGSSFSLNINKCTKASARKKDPKNRDSTGRAGRAKKQRFNLL